MGSIFLKDIKAGTIILHKHEIYIIIAAKSLKQVYGYFVCSIPDKDFKLNEQLIVSYVHNSYNAIYESYADINRVFMLNFKDKDKTSELKIESDNTRFIKWYLKSRLSNPELPMTNNLSDIYKKYYETKNYLTINDTFEIGKVYNTKGGRKHLVCLKNQNYYLEFYSLKKDMYNALVENENELFWDLIKKKHENVCYRSEYIDWYDSKSKVELYDSGLVVNTDILIDILKKYF